MAGSINLASPGFSRGRILWIWRVLVLVSAACGRSAMHLARCGVDGREVQAFAAGAMLTMLADAMMPEAFEHGGKPVGLFTVLGFLGAAVLSFMD